MYPRIAGFFCAIALAVLGFWSCNSDGGAFRLVSFRQAGCRDVKLNALLIFRFSCPVDPLSVDLSSIAIADDAGVRARGEWEVAGEDVRFHPAPPKKPDGAGAGLRFGRHYTVAIAGYPFHGTVLSTDGRPLARKETFFFDTVRRCDAPGLYAPYVDPVPGEGPRLLSVNGIPCGAIPPAGIEIPPGKGFVLEFSEALHPASLRAASIELKVFDGAAEWAGVKKTLPVTCAFLPDAGNRKVVIRPRSPLKPGVRYILPAEALPFTDLVGNRLHRAGFNYICFLCRE